MKTKARYMRLFYYHHHPQKKCFISICDDCWMDWIRAKDPFLLDTVYVIIYSLMSKKLKEIVGFIAQKRDWDINIYNYYYFFSIYLHIYLAHPRQNVLLLFLYPSIDDNNIHVQYLKLNSCPGNDCELFFFLFDILPTLFALNFL